MEDWFGNPIDDRDRTPKPPVPCPVCGAAFTARTDLARHLELTHDVDPRRIHGRPDHRRGQRLRRWWHGLGFLPLWFVLPLNAALVVLVWITVSDPIFDFTSGLLVRLALLPSILLLVARVASTGPRL